LLVLLLLLFLLLLVLVRVLVLSCDVMSNFWPALVLGRLDDAADAITEMGLDLDQHRLLLAAARQEVAGLKVRRCRLTLSNPR
jgi:hypothetical protein